MTALRPPVDLRVTLPAEVTPTGSISSRLICSENLMDKRKGLVPALKSDDVDHGKVMVESGKRELCTLPHVPEVDQVLVISREKIRLHLFVEFYGHTQTAPFPRSKNR